jgi:hypothetical protein
MAAADWARGARLDDGTVLGAAAPAGVVPAGGHSA